MAGNLAALRAASGQAVSGSVVQEDIEMAFTLKPGASVTVTNLNALFDAAHIEELATTSSDSLVTTTGLDFSQL